MKHGMPSDETLKDRASEKATEIHLRPFQAENLPMDAARRRSEHFSFQHEARRTEAEKANSRAVTSAVISLLRRRPTA